uniref:Uncharacterized protein n=1 Tax=Human betaherpesvirus 6A TaxID=32603 RepID=Q86575_9BETA|nr:orf LF2 [Human betaherpesvirus 6A]
MNWARSSNSSRVFKLAHFFANCRSVRTDSNSAVFSVLFGKRSTRNRTVENVCSGTVMSLSMSSTYMSSMDCILSCRVIAISGRCSKMKWRCKFFTVVVLGRL